MKHQLDDESSRIRRKLKIQNGKSNVTDSVKSCILKLPMGMTNDRRPNNMWILKCLAIHMKEGMEVCFCFSMPSETKSFPIMEEAKKPMTYFVVANDKVISPSWSITWCENPKLYVLLEIVGRKWNTLIMDHIAMEKEQIVS